MASRRPGTKGVGQCSVNRYSLHLGGGKHAGGGFIALFCAPVAGGSLEQSTLGELFHFSIIRRAYHRRERLSRMRNKTPSRHAREENRAQHARRRAGGKQVSKGERSIVMHMITDSAKKIRRASESQPAPEANGTPAITSHREPAPPATLLNQRIFEDVNGVPIPILPVSADGIAVVPDGLKLFDLDQAAAKWQAIGRRPLSHMWDSAFRDLIPADSPMAAILGPEIRTRVLCLDGDIVATLRPDDMQPGRFERVVRWIGSQFCQIARESGIESGRLDNLKRFRARGQR
jgi:hypothetical protein